MYNIYTGKFIFDQGWQCVYQCYHVVIDQIWSYSTCVVLGSYTYSKDTFCIIHHQLIVIWQDFIIPKHVNEEPTIYIEANRKVPNKWKTP